MQVEGSQALPQAVAHPGCSTGFGLRKRFFGRFQVAARPGAITPDRPIPLGKNIFPPRPATTVRPDRLLRREGPINRERTCARAPAHVRSGPMVNALGPQGECAGVIGHLRARLIAGKTAFLDARTAQHAAWKGLAFSHETRNSRPTIDLDLTRFSETTYSPRPGPLLDIWTGLLEGFRGPRCPPNVFEHTRLAPSRKAPSGQAASRPALFAGRTPSARRPGAPWGSCSAERRTSVPRP